jgi:hypothetical protein
LSNIVLTSSFMPPHKDEYIWWWINFLPLIALTYKI